jgi:hypothetical protein
VLAVSLITNPLQGAAGTNTHGDGEQQYNRCHKRTRVIVENSFGVMKARFRCLHKSGGCLTYSTGKCCAIIVACMVLHNMCIDGHVEGDYDDNEDDENDEDDDNNAIDHAVVQQIQQDADGWQVRRDLIAQRFAHD